MANISKEQIAELVGKEYCNETATWNGEGWDEESGYFTEEGVVRFAGTDMEILESYEEIDDDILQDCICCIIDDEDEYDENQECYRVYDCSEIFKDFEEGGEVTEKEIEVIKKYSPEYKYYDDEANGYTAFALNFFNEDRAFDLIDELNEISDGWYVGDENEEYVFVD